MNSSSHNFVCLVLLFLLLTGLHAQPNLRFKSHFENCTGLGATAVDLVIENNGNVTTPSTVMHTMIYDRISHTWDRQIPSLQPGQSYSIRESWDTSYWYCIWHGYILTLDYNDAVNESDENDNELSVRVYSGTEESCGNPGFLLNQCNYEYTHPHLRLETPFTSNHTIFWFELHLKGVNGNYTIVKYQDWYQIIPESYNIVRNIDVRTTGLPPGIYSIEGLAQTSYKWMDDIDDSNNELIFENAVVIPEDGSTNPDIYIKSPGTFPSTCPSSSFTHDLTIGNSGGTLEQNFKVCIYASQDQNITTSDYKLGCFTVTPSHFGSRNYCNLSITCDPSGLSGGTWYFGIIVDPDNELDEDNENDNSYCSSTSTTVEGSSTISVTAPSGGESWELGSTHTLRWSSNAGGSVKIYLYKQGSYYKTITSSTSNDGSYSWTIPQDYDEYAYYRIRIFSTSNSSIYDYSDGYFSLKSSKAITITSPNGGERWERETNQAITWSSNAGGNVKMELCNSIERRLISSTANDGYYSWLIPDLVWFGNFQGPFRIRLTSLLDTNITDYSDDYFTIFSKYINVDSPNGSEEWETGSTHTITWTSNAGGSVKIHLFKQGTFYKEITNSTNNDGRYSWTIPADYDEYSSYRIRITSTSNSDVYDYSDNYFSLKRSEQTDMVWPGDTNNSGYVDQADVLPIGLYFHSTGPRRSLSGNSWRGYEMSNWSNKAAGYADSDGSGTVDQGDVLAIGLNWHKSHTAALAKAHSHIFDHSLLLQLENSTDSRGPFIDIAVQNADGLTGISFELNLNLNNGNITFIEYLDVFSTDRTQYENIQADKLALGVSLKNYENAVNGRAKICRIYYQGQHGDDDIQLSNIVGMNNLGEYIGAVSESYSLACGQNVAPDKLVLYPNYPNPFNPITTIRYDVPESGVVRLHILNVKGEVVRTLVNQQQTAGSYAVQWDATRENGSKVASGVYLYRIQAGNQQFIQKLLYTK